MKLSHTIQTTDPNVACQAWGSSVQEQKEIKVDSKIDMNHNVDVSRSLN